MKLLQAFALAWNMLTIIPFLKVHHFYKGINALSAMMYPFVGFIIGFVIYMVSQGFEDVLPHDVLHVSCFFLLVVITGGIHLDGFSDTIDGLFVAKDKALQVMKDSHVGGMGMIFSVSFLILKATLFFSLEQLSVLIPILTLSRMGIVVIIYKFRYISSGIGELIKEELSPLHVNVALFFGFCISMFYGVVWAFILVLLYMLIVSQMFQRRYGGLNGDIYGFLIESSEVVLLFIAVLAGF
ncbi:MAG: adenosylcobinamide-GDP ribazoletransferase [Epsilonproteobacteria bacterium]|nr:adenosylcobinamide-GDP ribazoletransferase [Campylobacterota bacterium]